LVWKVIVCLLFPLPDHPASDTDRIASTVPNRRNGGKLPFPLQAEKRLRKSWEYVWEKFPTFRKGLSGDASGSGQSFAAAARFAMGRR